MKPLVLFSILLLATVIIVSGCAQQPAKQPSQQQESGSAPIKAPAQTTPIPTQVSVSGDVLGTELAKSDSIDSDLRDPAFDTLTSDLAEVESGL